MANVIAIVGRPNVGKSTLFNRLVEERKAIFDDTSGVTRDRHYGYGEWTGKHFTVIDTGGYVADSEDVFESAIRKQVEIAMQEATVIIFMTDASVGITPLDESFANILRNSTKPLFLVANKADNPERANMSNEFYSLGFTEVYPVSSMSGSGTGDLLDAVVQSLPDDQEEDPEADVPRFSILGKPNVGKSSMVNTLLGDERSIVTDIAGTTRDSINTFYKLYGKSFILTDTAGIRRKNRVEDNVEFYSVMRALRTMQDSDVCIVLIDADIGLEAQDMNIINLAHRHKKGIVLLVNKWDLVEKDHKTADEYRKLIIERLGPISYIPILFVSMLTKQRVFQAIEKASQVYENRQKKIATAELNEKMNSSINAYPPPAHRGQYVRIKYVTQIKTSPPAFIFFCNYPKYIKDAYKRYLENQLRKHFDFSGVPVQLYFRKK